MKPHIEITKQDMKDVADGGKHCQLIHDGWVYHENEDRTQGFYSNPNGFDCHNLCLDDAYKLNQMIKSWGQ